LESCTKVSTSLAVATLTVLTVELVMVGENAKLQCLAP
jgi:hypothetical protein